MKKFITYEWLIETLDNDGEIVDVDHSDTFPGFPTINQNIGVVCDDINGRSWAYIENGKLPEYLRDAFGSIVRKVPMRYINQVMKAKS